MNTDEQNVTTTEELKKIKRRAQNKAWREANKDKKREADRRYREANKEKNKEYMRVYYLEHKEEHNASSKAYRESHKEEAKEWRRENAESRRKYTREYNRQRKLTDEEYLMQVSLRLLVVHSFKRIGQNKPTDTLSLLGCTWLEAKMHFEKLFQEGMTWQNHGMHGWHIDHIRPISSFSLDEMHLANNINNLQPLWAEDNLSKGDFYVG